MVTPSSVTPASPSALNPSSAALPDERAEALRAKTADRILVQPASESANPSAVTASPDLNDLGTVVGAALREFTGRRAG
jgi:hypothetical protein